ncbi:MAG: hypothetical protein K2J67_06095, partial [Lachnospiraceae bacterium]|nr:hypothetical protein [Lachnospiraceae bacterium]
NGIIGHNVASCKSKFTENELNICENIRNYMMSDDIYGIVKKDFNALRILFRVCWICNEKKDPYSDFDKEWRTTKMDISQWQQINEICKYYTAACRYKNIEASYFINYIYALSTIELALISNLENTDDFKRTLEIINDISEKMFIGAKRMRVPFLISDAEGKAFTFDFKVDEVKKDNLGIMVMVNRKDIAEGIKFRVRAEHIGRTKIPEEGTYINGLSVGLSYTSFSLCKESGVSLGGRK